MFFKFLVLALVGSSFGLPNAHFHADVQVEKDGRFKDITGSLATGAKQVVDLPVAVAQTAAGLIGQVGGLAKGLIHKSKDLLDDTEGKVSSVFDKEISVNTDAEAQAGGEITGTLIIKAEKPSKSATAKKCACDFDRRSCFCPDAKNPSGYVTVSINADSQPNNQYVEAQGETYVQPDNNQYFKVQGEASYNQAPVTNTYYQQPQQTSDVQPANNQYVQPSGNQYVKAPPATNTYFKQPQQTSDVAVDQGNHNNKNTKIFQPGYYTPEAEVPTDSPTVTQPNPTYSG